MAGSNNIKNQKEFMRDSFRKSLEKNMKQKKRIQVCLLLLNLEI